MEQKFIYYLKHQKTGRVFGGLFSLTNIEEGNFLRWFSELADCCDIIAKVRFTGLHDKNNKDIYEGDIVHIYGGEYCQGFYEYNFKGIVTYCGSSFSLKNLNEDTYYGILDMLLDGDVAIEIIGNIYEK